MKSRICSKVEEKKIIYEEYKCQKVKYNSDGMQGFLELVLSLYKCSTL